MDHLGPDAKDHEVPSCKDEMLSQHKLAPDFVVLTEGGDVNTVCFRNRIGRLCQEQSGLGKK
jgi:hypothetical protein